MFWMSIFEFDEQQKYEYSKCRGFSHTQLTDFGGCIAIITYNDDFKNKK